MRPKRAASARMASPNAAMHRRARALSLCLLAAMAGPALAVEFAGTGGGPIPDGPASGGDRVCDASTQGPPLVVEFAVSGMKTTLHHVGLRITFAPAHTFVGDLHVHLFAPADAAVASIFGDTGLGLIGDHGSDAAGQYQFADDGPLDWWSASAAASDGETIAAGFYRATMDGSATASSLDATFGALQPAQVNGVWRLEITDDCEFDMGAVAFAALVLNASLPVDLQFFEVD